MLNRRDLIQGLLGTAGLAGTTMLSGLPGKAEDSRRIRIGQIGTGHAHATKLSVYRASPDYEVVGIVEPDAQLRKAAETNPVYQGLRWLTRTNC